jgi:hypothetical protein
MVRAAHPLNDFGFPSVDQDFGKEARKTMKKEKILFVCVHNSARSQMAEAFPTRPHFPEQWRSSWLPSAKSGTTSKTESPCTVQRASRNKETSGAIARFLFPERPPGIPM